MRRYAGMMFDIERTALRIMGARVDSRPQGVYAYELADLLRQAENTATAAAAAVAENGPRSLRANGTVYKLMYRLTRIGAVTSHWEEPEVALAEGRPRRRYYVLTENGRARARNIERRYRRRRRQGLPETDPRTFG